jgi:hypothetical protein
VSQVPAIQLNDGADIPQLGRGVYKIEPTPRARVSARRHAASASISCTLAAGERP